MTRLGRRLLRLAAPFRRRHPIVLSGLSRTEAARIAVRLEGVSQPKTAAAPVDYYVVERDPTDEAGA